MSFSSRISARRVASPRFALVLSCLVFAGLASVPSVLVAQVPLPPMPDPHGSDQGAGASLLVPYFEIDLDDPEGRNTLVGLGLIGSEGQSDTDGVPARVTLWTDLGVPVLSFDLFLDRNGVRTLNLGHILRGGIPVTAPRPEDAALYPSCSNPLARPRFDLAARQELIARLTGMPDTEGMCSASPSADPSLLTGYLTVDALNDCAPLDLNPTSPGYFAEGGGGAASNRNLLWGDVALIDSRADSAQGFRAVSLTADSGRFPGVVDNGGAPTFYAHYSGGTDHRRPLAASHQTRFMQGVFDGGTDLLLWNAGLEAAAPRPCDEPLEAIFDWSGWVFDESTQRQSSVRMAATRRVDRITPGVTPGFEIEQSFGSIHLTTGLQSLFQWSPVQSWATPIFEAEGRFSVGLEGAAPGAVDRFAESRGCLLDDSPGATLLVPYFEVDLDDPEGPNTLVAISAVGERIPEEDFDPVLARVTVWTDYAIPVFAFDIFLERGGVQTLNLRRVLAGELPAGAATRDEIPFPNCSSPLALPTLDADFVTDLREVLTGRPSPWDGLCWSGPRGEGASLAVGFLTVDVVTACSADPFFNPRGEGYFAALDSAEPSHASDRNLLWGDVILIDESENAAQGYAAPALPADADRFGPVSGGSTFYSRLAWTTRGEDHRMPLTATYRGRFFNGGPFDGGSEWLVWGNAFVTDPLECTDLPSTCCAGLEVTAWNEAGDELGHRQIDDTYLWTRRLRVGGEFLPIEAPFGLLEVEAWSIPQGSVILPAPERTQGWATPLLSASGRFSLSWPATQRDWRCQEEP